MVSVTGSTICVTLPISSAIHVTMCSNTELWSDSHQLRLHDSEHLHLHCRVSAGAILERCAFLEFWLEADAPKIDIRDFQWLKYDSPSPNYSVNQEKIISRQQEKPRGTTMKQAKPIPKLTCKASSQSPLVEEDEEEEL